MFSPYPSPDTALSALRIRHKGRSYRLTVYPLDTLVEVEPTNGVGVHIARRVIEAYEDIRGEWDYKAIGDLIAAYERERATRAVDV